MDYPNNGDVLELFQYTADEPTRFTYRYHHISRTLKALGNSVKTSLRLSEDGVLSLQFMMPEIKGVENVTPFIEFKVGCSRFSTGDIQRAD
jgi:cell cycle checkpoint protein